MFKLFTRWVTKVDTQAGNINFHLKSGNLGLTYIETLIINGKPYKLDWEHINMLKENRVPLKELADMQRVVNFDAYYNNELIAKFINQGNETFRLFYTPNAPIDISLSLARITVT